MSVKIKKVLIANRGEIAVRINRACTDMGIKVVSVFSEADRMAFHVRLADEAYCVGPAPSNESYLVQDNLIAAAKKSGADAIHPGYGFLAENAEFAKRCEDEGIIFIGPRSETIALLGDKLMARETAAKANLPLVPSTTIETDNLKRAAAEAEKIGFPVLIKAAAGGGGKGMRICNEPSEFEQAVKSAGNEARAAFGDDRVYVEKYLERPRHIEIQILCDQHGNCVHLGERECSIQRRHQKLIEETPSPVVTPELRRKMGEAAVNIARETGYVGAGTVEFMFDEAQGAFYFLEVNTRLQVEHPVTEMITGLDLVKQQILIAEGHKLPFTQDEIEFKGHAIEFRICAENPEASFVPSTGKLFNYRLPAGPGVRVDSGVIINSEVPIYYDPLIAKLIVYGSDRTEAISRAKRALEEYRIAGVDTTIGFHRSILDNENFVKGNLSTSFLAEEYPDGSYVRTVPDIQLAAALAAALDKFSTERKIAVKVRDASEAGTSEWVRVHRRTNMKNFRGRG